MDSDNKCEAIDRYHRSDEENQQPIIEDLPASHAYLREIVDSPPTPKHSSTLLQLFLSD